MRADEAVRYVNGLAFKPGWRPIAEHYTYSHIRIGFIIETVDTSYPDGDGICRDRITILGRDRLVDVTDLDEEGLCAEVLKCAADNDSHENREFLKARQPDGSWQAPLHPHTPAGNRAWDRHTRPQQPARTSSATGLMQLLGLED
jgi:hypothetical protein